MIAVISFKNLKSLKESPEQPFKIPLMEMLFSKIIRGKVLLEDEFNGVLIVVSPNVGLAVGRNDGMRVVGRAVGVIIGSDILLKEGIAVSIKLLCADGYCVGVIESAILGTIN